jgi:hypothetical protein
VKDLELLKGRFLSCEFLKEEEYLRHYFPLHEQQQFVIYYHLFPYQTNGGVHRFVMNFTDHTGVPCSVKWVYKMLKRLRTIEGVMAKAVADKDVVLIDLLKSGHYPIFKKNRPNAASS